jgi:hypothetical protein
MDQAGIADGGGNLPPTHAIDPTPIEQQVINYTDTRLKETGANFTKRVEAMVSEAKGLTAEITEDDFLAAENAAINKVTLVLREHRQDYLSATKEYLQSWAAFNRFKAQNKLDRPAKYPASHAPHITVLAFLVVLEAILNSTLLASGNQLGMTGGFLVAIAISLFSVFVGFLAGRIAGPRFAHIESRERLSAWLATFGWLLIMFSFQLLFAHYRDIAETSKDAAKAAAEAMGHMTASPFQLKFEGVILFALGLAFSVIAYIDGLTWDDRYLAYSDVDRDMKKHQAQREDVRRRIETAVRTSVQQAREEATRLRETAEANASRLHTLAAQRDGIAKDFEATRGKLEDDCQERLHAYRNANVNVRTTQPPSYFSVMPSHIATLDMSSLEQVSQWAETLTASLPRISKLENQSHQRETDRLRTALEMVSTQIDEWDREANRKTDPSNATDPQ